MTDLFDMLVGAVWGALIAAAVVDMLWMQRIIRLHQDLEQREAAKQAITWKLPQNKGDPKPL